jgi:hypothetical protein
MSCCEDPLGKNNEGNKFNDTWDPSDCTPGGRTLWYSCSGFIGAFIVIAIPCIMAASATVGYEDNAVLVDSGGTPTEVVGPGRHWPGIQGKAVTYPRFDGTIEYTKSTSSSISVRVNDGQIVELDLSFQYALKKEDLMAIYNEYKSSSLFVSALKQLARSSLRDRAANRTSQQFFTDRTAIEADMRAQLSALARERDATITGFQIRRVYVPDTLNDRLIQIEMSKQDAREAIERVVVDEILANTERERLILETERVRTVTTIKQATQVQEAEEAQRRNQIEQTTIQDVTRITEESRREVTLYNQQTDLQIEDINLQITIVEEATRSQTEALRIAGETQLQLYEQNTTNLQLDYEKQIALIEETTRQKVAQIEADTSGVLENFLATLANKKAKTESQARKDIAAANQAAEQQQTAARLEGYESLPGFMFLAEEIANSTLPGVKYMDASTESLVDTALSGSFASLVGESTIDLQGSGAGP